MTYPTDYADPYGVYPIDLDPSDLLKQCPICKKEMRVDYQNDQDGERGYYAICDNCNIYFGIDSEAVDMGYCWGKYGSEDALIKSWNDTVWRADMEKIELKPCQCGSDVELCRGDDDYYIYCPKCKLQTFSDRVYENITDNCDRLIEVWNRRAKDGKSE